MFRKPITWLGIDNVRNKACVNGLCVENKIYENHTVGRFQRGRRTLNGQPKIN